jgi:DNA polymerase-3 subunit epsilon
MAVFDLETTGVDVETDRIISACVGTVNARGAQATEYLINPGVPIPPGASEVNGFNDEYVREHGSDPGETVELITSNLATSMLSGAVLVAYNMPFDVTMLDRECRRHGIATLHDRLGAVPFMGLDPLVLDKALNKFVKGKGQRRLTPTCARYGIELKNAHDAAADALAAGEMARRLHLEQPGDSARVVASRKQLGEASIADLQGWQRAWHERDSLSLADWFRQSGDQAAYEDISARAGLWPYIPAGTLD